MERICPSYYNEFRCIADRCPDSCCHEWIIDVDEESAARFRALPGPLGDLLRAQLAEEDGVIFLNNIDGRCPMWRSDGLCALQVAHGHDALCQICQQFPRFRQDYGDFEETGIEMSCPEAARIMLNCESWTLETKPCPAASRIMTPG